MVGRVDYTPLQAYELTGLVLTRLPMHFPEIDPIGRGDWEVMGPAMIVRASTATNALFKLGPGDSWLAAEAIARTIIETTITYAWLAADPSAHVPVWLAGNDAERRRADNKHVHWLVEGGYREEPVPLLRPEIREIVESEAGAITALADRAKAADAKWRPQVPELSSPNCSFAEIYASAYTHYSWATHALVQPLYRYTGAHPEGGVFVGAESNDGSSTPWGVGLLVYSLGLIVSSAVVGWPDAGRVRELVVAAA